MKNILIFSFMFGSALTTVFAHSTNDDLVNLKKSHRLQAVLPKKAGKSYKQNRAKIARKLKNKADVDNMTSMLNYFKGTVRVAYDAARILKKQKTYFSVLEDPSLSKGQKTFGAMLEPILNLGNISTELCNFMGFTYNPKKKSSQQTFPTITKDVNDLTGLDARITGLGTRLAVLETASSTPSAPSSSGVTMDDVNSAITSALNPLAGVKYFASTLTELANNTDLVNVMKPQPMPSLGQTIDQAPGSGLPQRYAAITGGGIATMYFNLPLFMYLHYAHIVNTAAATVNYGTAASMVRYDTGSKEFIFTNLNPSLHGGAASVTVSSGW